MTNRFKEILAGTRALESRLAAMLEGVARTAAGAAGSQPLEIVERATDEVARHVLPAGRGRYAFPFNSITITFVAESTEAEAQFEVVCAGPPTLLERVQRRLALAGCEASVVDVAHGFVTAPDPSWPRPEFNAAFARTEHAEPVAAPAAPRIDLLVAHGAADRGAYTFTTTPIAIGRGIEVRDSRQLLLRVNHVAFAEGADEVTQSVSRRHARIERDEATGRYRLIDDNSARGTSIVRGGRGIAVPRGSHGLALRDGDEVVLGEARLRVRIPQ